MTDLDIIEQIEKKLKVKLEKLDKIEWSSRGYILNSDGQVRGLGLSGCEIENLKGIISPLFTLTNLTQLDLSKSQVRDISLLSALTDLTQLDLSDNQITDISPLSALTNLTQLYLIGNRVQ